MKSRFFFLFIVLSLLGGSASAQSGKKIYSEIKKFQASNEVWSKFYLADSSSAKISERYRLAETGVVGEAVYVSVQDVNQSMWAGVITEKGKVQTEFFMNKNGVILYQEVASVLKNKKSSQKIPKKFKKIIRKVFFEKK